MDLHVLSALWIAKVGQKYDSKLPECAFGNRVRRKINSEFNTLSIGSFMPYLHPFRKWRDNGFNAMRKALGDDKKIIAITADVKSFYHRLNPDFMLDRHFLDRINLTLSTEEEAFTRLFFRALENWAKSTPLRNGLPVGLPASGIIANMALIELDFIIKKEIVPLYYGRYVDDIILVMENTAGFCAKEEVWDWIIKRSNNLLQWKDSSNSDREAIQFLPDYHKKSTIEFSNKKNKVFMIEGASGVTLIDSLDRQIRERTSEWRALPNLPRNPEAVPTDLLSATQRDGEAADNLRKADSLILRRAGFAIKLRDFEAYDRDLPPESWEKHRHAFLKAFIDHVLVLPLFFELAQYLPRVIRMATSCEDFSYLKKIIESLQGLLITIQNNCNAQIKSCDPENSPSHQDIISIWEVQINQSLEENIKASFPPRPNLRNKTIWEKHFVEAKLLKFDCSIKTLQTCQKKLFNHDLAHIPFRFIGLPKEQVSKRKLPSKKEIEFFSDTDYFINTIIHKGLKTVSRWIKCYQKNAIPFGLLFATRPFRITELYLLTNTPFNKKILADLSESILALRGFSVAGKLPRHEKDHILDVPVGNDTSAINIAIASWKTNLNSWVASVAGIPDLSASRYQKLNDLINVFLTRPLGSNYFVMPELSMPSRWFMRIAQKLQGRGVSFITGIEYLHRPKKTVSNQVWAALKYDGLGFPSMILYRQDKQRPALHEENELARVSGLKLRPDKHWNIPPIICHGNFHFALLICSELTNLSYRSSLRGNIDALLVPEWNQDTESFNALVESAALDIHAFIIQCNDRQYGDSRIRAPFRDSWKRDIVRIKGGKNDYYVIGKIDIQTLRQFQSCHRSPDGPFKPVPDGFEIAFSRKTVPLVGVNKDTH